MIDKNEKQDIRDEYIYSNYTDIYKKLKKVTNTYLKAEDINKVRKIILEQRRRNEDNLENRLIELPENNMKSTIKSTYTKIDYLDGTIGTVEATDQFDGITNMTLLVFMSNRLSKSYRHKIKNENLSPETKEIYRKNERALLRWKDIATKDLLASLYILDKTESEYKDFISYGHNKDKEGNDAFIIDLPFFGQISVHFGNKKPDIITDAQETVIGILQKKQELGQISQEEAQQLIKELDEDTILPEYTGKLYEYKSMFPIEYEGKNIKTIKENLGLKGKLPEEIDEYDIERICNSGLNDREIYYFAIKLGLSKKQLEQIFSTNKKNNKKLDGNEIGRSALNSTNAEERKAVNEYEVTIQDNLQQNENNK